MKTGIIYSTDPGMPDKNAVLIVTDILRASTLITTAFACGAAAVYPVLEVEEAFPLAKKHTALLAGERNCVRVKGFDFTNSPVLLNTEKIPGRNIVFTSTNFPRAFYKTEGARHVLIGSFANVSAVTKYAAAVAEKNGLNITYVLAANRKYAADEDIAFAGESARLLRERGFIPDETLAGIIDRCEAEGYETVVKNSVHAKRLAGLGLGHDVEFACRKDIFPVVPAAKDGRITLVNTV